MAGKAITTQQTTPLSLLSSAVSSGANIEQLTALMELQERHEANEARKAYTVSMAKFKSEPPEISKDQDVKYGKTHYSHASLANVTKTINAALAKCGLSAGWKTAQDNGMVSVTCFITHEMGHSESTTLSSPPDVSGNKNSIQAIGSAVTYLSRYTLLAITGIATGESDDDGAGYEPEQNPLADYEQLETGIDWFYENKKSPEELKVWFAGKADDVKALNKFEQEKIQNVFKAMLIEVENLENEVHNKLTIDVGE